MVDLVKIRKKAREQKASADEASRETTPGTPESPAPSGRTEGRKAGSRAKKKTKRGGSTTKREDGARDGVRADEESHVPAPEEPSGIIVSGSLEPGSPKEESRLSRFKRTAGIMEHAAEEASDVVAESAEELLELITFALAGEQYAMDVGQLVEIIVPRVSTRVPNASEEVIGIISLRGSIVTLLDLRRILGHPGKGEETEDTRIVVVQHDTERIGFIVDRVLRVVKVDPGSIEPHPVVSAAERNEVVHGVFVSGNAIAIYLDLNRIAG